jgi:ectoine hydroxylase-related dioxygenase (phytanoyl-CoA dioxygenase family)
MISSIYNKKHPPDRFADSGFAVVDHVAPHSVCDQLVTDEAISNFDGAGSRELIAHRSCRELASSLKNHVSIRTLLPSDPVAIQCTLFNKSPLTNWLVSLHQDLSIPVLERVQSPLCSGWSEKDGQWFVQPPVDVLECLVAVRIHLDSSTAENGPLRVVPGSHRFGRLMSSAAHDQREQRGELALLVSRGGAIVMRPLLLHASSKAIAPMSRRVLHMVFAPRELPYGLKWGLAV